MIEGSETRTAGPCVVMVGVDGSGPAAEACRWAAGLCKRTNAQLIVASAWLPIQAEGAPADVLARRREAELVLDHDWGATARFSGVEPRSLLFRGTPDALLEAAEAEGAKLLVVGNRGAGGIAALHLGSVAHHLARHTTQPLAIVPAPHARNQPEVIVLGIDGSPGSAAAVRWCAEAASALSARVVGVTAFEPFLEWVPTTDPRSWRQNLQRHVDEWILPLREAKVPVETVIVRDVHPVAAIAEVAKNEGADLLVVGTHGLGGFTGMRLGGVALQLVHHSALPVVLVPPSWAGTTPPSNDVKS